MNRLEELSKKVAQLYGSKQPTRADWADWLYDNHVVIVADYARKLAKKYGANEELAEVAALLHDIADYTMKRANPHHEAESLEIARDLMRQHDYSDEEIKLVVDDAIRFHSCHGDEKPQSKEGLVLATADSLAHLKTDFYVFIPWALGMENSLEDIKKWVLEKIDRDLYKKIQFEDERTDATPDYQIIKNLYSR